MVWGDLLLQSKGGLPVATDGGVICFASKGLAVGDDWWSGDLLCQQGGRLPVTTDGGVICFASKGRTAGGDRGMGVRLCEQGHCWGCGDVVWGDLVLTAKRWSGLAWW